MTTPSFFPETVIVKIRDKDISITPLPVKNLSKAARVAAPLLSSFQEGKIDAMVVLANVDTVIELVSIATNESVEWLGELDLAALIELLTAIISTNMDFFSAKILPQAMKLIQSVETIAKKPIA